MQTDTTKLHLSAPMWHAILMRNEGRTYQAITVSLEQQFERTYSLSTVKHWFAAGGSLEPHLQALEDELANEAIRQAVLMAKKVSLRAVEVLGEIMEQGKNPYHRIAAAKAILEITMPAQRRNGCNRRFSSYSRNEVPEEILYAR